MNNVIIGAGPAGVVAAEALRKQDPEARITLLGNEPEPPYSRMALPYLLVNRIDETGTYLRKADDHYEAKRIEYRVGQVSRLDTQAKTIALSDGDSLPFDHALIATGSSPLQPPIPGLALPGVHSCWTLEDARRILALTKPGANVLLIGAGFVGCIVLEALATAGVKLHVVEQGPRMVPRMLDDVAGAMLAAWCEMKDVRVHTDTRVESIEQRGLFNRHLAATLSSGDTVDADLIVTAVGVKPNVDFLQGSGVKVDHGVLIDRHMRTNAEGVYAAGDVAQGLDFSTGSYSVQAIQPTAVEHGRIAGINMAGGDAYHDGALNMNVLDTLGLISTSFGLWEGVEDGETAMLVDQAGYRYVKLCFREDRLVGAQTVGLNQYAGVLRGLIQSKLRLGVWKDKLIVDPTRVMEAYLAQQLPGIPT